ncbi:MAG: hypothetical protein AAF989_15155 [Planctomycetota bacterium]
MSRRFTLPHTCTGRHNDRFNAPIVSPALLFFAVCLLPAACPSSSWGADAARPVVRFDLRPTVAFRSVGDDRHVEACFVISSLVENLDESPFDQWSVRIVPRDESMHLVDYAPRTKTASLYDGSVAITTTNEDVFSFGLNGAGSPGPLHVDGGLERNQKNSKTKSYKEWSPVRAVTAAGSVERGRGVYFKLRQSQDRVLEGEKQFTVVFEASPAWRGAMFDVSITAEKVIRTFGGLDQRTKTVCRQDFAIAGYRDTDADAFRWAKRVDASEQELRRSAHRHQAAAPSQSLPHLLHGLASKLDPWDKDDRDLESTQSKNWIRRLISGKTDPYTDPTIRKLPVGLRATALDYCDACKDVRFLHHDARRAGLIGHHPVTSLDDLPNPNTANSESGDSRTYTATKVAIEDEEPIREPFRNNAHVAPANPLVEPNGDHGNGQAGLEQYPRR